jgi:hypothetical protein
LRLHFRKESILSDSPTIPENTAYAHTLPGISQEGWEPLEHHLAEVATLTREFAGAFGAAEDEQCRVQHATLYFRREASKKGWHLMQTPQKKNFNPRLYVRGDSPTSSNHVVACAVIPKSREARPPRLVQDWHIIGSQEVDLTQAVPQSKIALDLHGKGREH